MANETKHNIKLGIFVLAGTLFLMVILYLMGEKRSLFGSTFRISAEFNNVNGLMSGNNVRFGGINVGTVEDVQINSDSTILVTMLIEEGVKQYIHKDARASIGTDGLMGNKLVNINSSGQAGSAPVEEGYRLATVRPIETDEMLRTLNTTNENIKVITADLRKITQRINSRNTLWSLLMDTVVAENVKDAIVSIKLTGVRSATITGDLERIVAHVKQGKGMAGALLTDTSLSGKIETTLIRLDKVSDKMATISGDLSAVSGRINKGEGAIGMLVMDTTFVRDLKSAVKNAGDGAAGFKDNMEALKQNSLLKKYFRKMEKDKKKGK